MKKIFNIQTLIFLAVLLLPAIVRADAPSYPEDVNDAPIDGGLSLLVAAGVGYGIQKLKAKKQQKDTDVSDK